MIGTLYLAWRYLLYNRVKTIILVGSITLILYLPVGLRVLVDQSAQQLTARARATPLVIGAKGSPLELVLNTLYFSEDRPEVTRYEEMSRIAESDLATAIPVHIRLRARGSPIVGTTLEYFQFRDLQIEEGRQFALLGECVLGSRVAERLEVGPGGSVISSPERVFDLAGAYPLKMRVAGVLAFSDGPDDDAVFVDLKTAWVIEGLGHGHQDLTESGAAGAILSRDENNITANASVVQYNEITPENTGSFHFHGDLSSYPISAVIAVPPDAKSAALLQGRYQASEEIVQITRPAEVMDDLLGTILTVRTFVVTGAVILGIATLATAVLVFLLSLRLRRRERLTLFKIGGSRTGVAGVMASEIVAVLAVGVLFSGIFTAMTYRFGSVAIRAIIRTWS